MSEFKLVDLPAAFRRPLNGMCMINLNNEDFLAAWYDSNVLISSVNVKESACSTLKVKDRVRCVFQNRASVFCVDESGTVSILSCIKNEDDVDIFDSSADDDFNSMELGKSFVEAIIVKNIVCVRPLYCGFILLKHDFGKLYVELYDSNRNDNELKKSACIELCSICDISVSQCCLKVFSADSMTPDFRQQFIKTCGANVDIVFIGLPTGCVYNVVVSSESSIFLSQPVLMYKCPYSVFDIVSLAGAQDKLSSQVGIVLTCGIVVVVSHDIISGSLCYKLCNLPSCPQVLMEIGNSFMFGDGLNLWLCTMDKSTVVIENNLLNVKGVCLIVNYSENNNILLVTVHYTFYTFSLKGSGVVQNVKAPSTCHFTVNEITESLYKELLQIELYKREISCEENLISAISMFSRYTLYEKLFCSTVSVQNLSCMPVENYILNYCSSDDFGEILTGKNSLSSLFVINTVVENQSDFEFSPFAWSLITSVTSDNITSQKCEKLLRSFSSGSSLSSSFCVCITQPFLGVSMSVCLVRQLPEGSVHCTGMPWLIIPLVIKKLDITYFLKSSTTEVKNSYVFSEKMLYLAQKRNPNCNKLLTGLNEKLNIFEPCYTYEFCTYQDSNVSELWLLIQKLCGYDNLVGGSKTVHCNPIGNKFCVCAGNEKVEFILSKKNIKISSVNPLLLHTIKNIIISKWIFHSDLVPSIPLCSTVVARTMLHKEKLQIAKMTCSRAEFSSFKNAWRHFVSEYLSM